MKIILIQKLKLMIMAFLVVFILGFTIGADNSNNLESQPNLEKKTDGPEWQIESAPGFILHPFFMFHSGFRVYYRENLYRKIDSKWEKWVTLRPIVDSKYDEVCDAFNPIYWEDNNYLYIFSCAGYTEEKSCADRKMKVNIYKVSIYEKNVIAKIKLDSCLGDLPSWEYYSPTPNFIYKIIMNNKNIFLVITDWDLEFRNTKLINIKSDFSDELNCCIIDNNYDFEEINVEINYNILKIKMKDKSNKIIEKNINIDEIKNGQCN